VSISKPASASQKRIAAIWTRDVDPSRLAGRPKIIQAIRNKMSQSYNAEHRRLHNILEIRSMRVIAETIAIGIRSFLSGSAPPLQCLLYCDRANHFQIRKELQSNPPESLYCDGVRTYYFLKHLGHLREQMRVVVDFDDLMSRRMQSLAAADTQLSLGYLHRKIPSWLQRTVSLGCISKAVARYEQRALIRVENEIGNWADAVVLISQVEGDELQARYKSLRYKARVHVVPPPVEIVAAPQRYEAFSRFIFIGTDTLPQNKLTIELILNLWRSVQPGSQIHIFGHMVHDWPHAPGVIFEGYVSSLEQVYLKGAVMFAPGVLRGGLKTKVAEAFAYGCAVVGNEITMEGLHLADYPLIITTDMELAEIIANPAAYLSKMSEAACLGQQYVQSFVSREKFEKNWEEVLG
jgi:glycosyltransferase involved in cell wall biosynthesis